MVGSSILPPLPMREVGAGGPPPEAAYVRLSIPSGHKAMEIMSAPMV